MSNLPDNMDYVMRKLNTLSHHVGLPDDEEDELLGDDEEDKSTLEP
eukprot:CAMPEP_0198151638 /NCGR_PEP_ID=MMETSP1443-20131203/56401_1 /TAXON_ID=186043 /ORGANISM="Entomoneis sp., Strain CCMP2396" /LENGTH=45 /DNA_ID= /DNA_START= /DNA_END= /DNA_ORIENTATION=